jgi:hypothetical protein
MDVQYFRPRRPGPEVQLENVVAERIPDLFGGGAHPMWTAGSVPIGAGRPDLVVVSYRPEVLALADLEMPNAHVLAYLRAAGSARLGTLTDRMRRPRQTLIRCVNGLVELDIVSRDAEILSLSPQWREILPEVVTIEVKVTDWRRAVDQAARNCIFAHRSFVAVPEAVAERVRREPVFARLGIGVLSVTDDNDVCVRRRGRRHRPSVWAYYYRLASLVAIHQGG